MTYWDLPLLTFLLDKAKKEFYKPWLFGADELSLFTTIFLGPDAFNPPRSPSLIVISSTHSLTLIHSLLSPIFKYCAELCISRL